MPCHNTAPNQRCVRVLVRVCVFVYDVVRMFELSCIRGVKKVLDITEPTLHSSCGTTTTFCWRIILLRIPWYRKIPLTILRLRRHKIWVSLCFYVFCWLLKVKTKSGKTKTSFDVAPKSPFHSNLFQIIALCRVVRRRHSRPAMRSLRRCSTRSTPPTPGPSTNP